MNLTPVFFSIFLVSSYLSRAVTSVEGVSSFLEGVASVAIRGNMGVSTSVRTTLALCMRLDSMLLISGINNYATKFFQLN